MTFASFKNARIVRSSWLDEGGRRLDCNPYMSGALEARDALSRLSVQTEKLADLTDDIFHAGREGRLWVDDPEFGVPFLGSSDILCADLSHLPLIAKRQVAKNPKFKLGEQWTLITRSGTIGRMTYVSKDTSGMACSEHVLRVVPKLDRIFPGYLYAYLASRYGVPLVVSGTYGAIIQHIEPEHIAGLPVPRFGDDIEGSIHSLISEAAVLRDEAGRCLSQAMSDFLAAANLPVIESCGSVTPFSTSSVPASSLQRRCDGFFHSRYHSDVVDAIRDCGLATTSIGQIARGIQEPNRFKRIVLDADSGGVPLFGTSAIFWNDPEPSYYLPRRLAAPYVVGRSTLLIPRSGQLQGVIGRPVLPYGDIIGGAVSEDAIRINCHSEIQAGFLFVFLSSEYGLRQLKARTFGTSIPHLDVRQISACVIPELSPTLAETIGKLGLRVSELRSDALNLEREARLAVERAIEEHA
ncbi:MULTISPECIES: methylation-associated defense system restriction endonuclease subunit S MAD5 [unclassified Pseudomonas]|jgi:type I restriction enzyme S subunit|uniref:methylation-associated defense system restriction endonuclease subunit S MAD5 n=1 Tax=unclassified Pseudomonas TaxID=196821 RepID=UPI000C9A4EAD|nr:MULTISPECIES: restriction endonuclease subunit S [unclassified Pseudomonas]MBP5946375.1 restriction endonuclease subunit S [Pseudomonas sp. P9(2020)]MBZ9564514.1 restriction endonuclease subunit S [Pseudomonas sp. P116]PNB49082.1 restriction endonuclease subunit S [Pseudomonas sp. GW456-12-10-14-LB2]